MADKPKPYRWVSVSYYGDSISVTTRRGEAALRRYMPTPSSLGRLVQAVNRDLDMEIVPHPSGWSAIRMAEKENGNE